MSKLWGAVSRAVLLGALVGVVLAGILFGLNRMSLGRGGEDAVARGFDSGSLVEDDLPTGNTDIGGHQFNDCLILGMAIDQRHSKERLTVSPSLPFSGEEEPLCPQLRETAAQGASNADRGFYHNYLHGHTTLARYLLPVMEIRDIRNLYRTALAVLIASGIALSLLRLAAGASVAPALLWTIVFFTLARWFGLEVFGQSLGHAPSDFVLLGFALFLAIQSPRLSPRSAMVACAVFGSLTMIFEFMTGGLPLGLALIVGGLPFALRADAPRLPSVAVSIAAYGSAAAACMAVKLSLVGIVFGRDALAGVFNGLAVRVGGEVPSFAGDTLLGSLAVGMEYLAPGLGSLGSLMLVIAVAAGAWGAATLFKTQERERAMLLAASNLPILAWFALFQQHSVVHAWFMARMLAWCIASGLALFALALLARQVRPA